MTHVYWVQFVPEWFSGKSDFESRTKSLKPELAMAFVMFVQPSSPDFPEIPFPS